MNVRFLYVVNIESQLDLGRDLHVNVAHHWDPVGDDLRQSTINGKLLGYVGVLRQCECVIRVSLCSVECLEHVERLVGTSDANQVASGLWHRRIHHEECDDWDQVQEEL